MNENLNKFINNIHFGEILVNVCVGVGMMSIFLTVFYFYYVVSIEHQMIIDNVNIMTTSLLDAYKPFLTPYTKNYIQKSLKTQDMSSADAQVTASNNQIQSDAIKNVSIIFSASLFVGFLLSYYFKVNFISILINNLLLVVLLGFTEYTFLHMVPTKIITGDPNFIKYKVFSNINQKIIFE